MTATILAVMLCIGADTPTIRLPEVVTVAPQPVPVPAAPDATIKLTPDLLYVIDSDVPILVLESPRGRVLKTTESGPVKIRGRFVGGTGRVETKTFAGKHVVSIEAATSGPVELLIVPQGAAAEADVKRVSLVVEAGEGPRPPPVPDVKPEPVKPETDTNPFGVDDGVLRVLWYVDNSKPFPADQLSAIYGKSTETYLAAKGAKNRKYQPNEDGSKDEPAFARAAKLKRDSIPWVYVGKGKRGESVRCPDTPEAMLELLKKYGGE